MKEMFLQVQALSRVTRTVKNTISLEDTVFYSTHRACRTCLLALQHELIFRHEPDPSNTWYKRRQHFPDNSTGATNATGVSEQGSSTTPSTAPSESQHAAPNTSTPATTTSQAPTGSSVTSLSPSEASYQASLLPYSMRSDLIGCLYR